VPRYPSDHSIRRRAEIAYHHAQALSRNSGYRRDVQRLVESGFRFNEDGSPCDSPQGMQISLVQRIRQRSGLRIPILPDRLRKLTLEEILAYDVMPLFKEIPGWDIRLKEPARSQVLTLMGDASRPLTDWGPIVSERKQRDLVQRFSVPMRRLSKRHRGISEADHPPEDLYSQYWRVYDLRQKGKSEREILKALWPEELTALEKQRERGALSPSAKNFLRQRVYDYEKRAKGLIRAAYPPLRHR